MMPRVSAGNLHLVMSRVDDVYDLLVTNTVVFLDKVKHVAFVLVDIITVVVAFVFWSFMHKMTTDTVTVTVAAAPAVTEVNLWDDSQTYFEEAKTAKNLTLAAACFLAASVIVKGVNLSGAIANDDKKVSSIVRSTFVAFLFTILNITGSWLFVFGVTKWIHFLAINTPTVIANAGFAVVEPTTGQLSTSVAGPVVMVLHVGFKILEYAQIMFDGEKYWNRATRLFSVLVVGVVYSWLTIKFRPNDGNVQNSNTLRYANCPETFDSSMESEIESIRKTAFYTFAIGAALVFVVFFVDIVLAMKSNVKKSYPKIEWAVRFVLYTTSFLVPLIVWAIFYGRVGKSYFQGICFHTTGDTSEYAHYFAPAFILGWVYATSVVSRLSNHIYNQYK